MQEKSDTPSVKGKNYADFSREELLAEIQRLKKTKKYGLVWEHKTEQVIEDFKNGQQPYLEEVTDKRIENAKDEPTNLIIEGDNFDALSILNYTHAGKIDVIYIDPPYNTGNKDFIYNDNYVDSEDTFRHSKWLSFMEPRLKLARNLLAEDGVILISIDDREYSDLKMMCDTVLGADNFVNTFIWRGGKRNMSKWVSTSHEYMLTYAKNLDFCSTNNIKWSERKRGLSEIYAAADRFVKTTGKNYEKASEELRKWFKALPDDNPSKDHSHYCWIDERGVYFASDISRGGGGGPTWKIKNPKTDEYVKTPQRGWAYSSIEELENDISNGLIHFNGNGVPCKKRYLRDNETQIMDSVFYRDRRGSSKRLRDLMGGEVFPFPKDENIIADKIRSFGKDGSIVLDFFAGSGTTGQAVLELNKEDGGHRQFILCTNNGDKGPDSTKIAEDITYPRIKTVITGKRMDGSKYSDGIPANLRYYKINHLEKKQSLDAYRQLLVDKMEEILQIKENVFEQVEIADDFALYQNAEKYLGFVYDPFALDEIIEKLEEVNKEKKDVVLYVFSYSRDAFSEDYDVDFNIEFKAMPEGLLKTYRNILEELRKEEK